jgi:hypothetical protein
VRLKKPCRRKKKPIESVKGSYTPIPHAVLDSVAFRGSSSSSKALLFDVLRQHTGANNGHFQLYTGWLFSRGWKSAGTIQKAKEELIERGLITKTRWGGLNAGADLFAVTWVDISNFTGLDIERRNYHPGAWAFMDKLPVVTKRDLCSEFKNDTVPEYVIAQVSVVPKTGTKKPRFTANPFPKSGNNECLPLPPTESYKQRRRVVGRKGRSGVLKNSLIAAQ